MTESKPPVGELPDVIYVVGKSIDLHSDFEGRNNMWSHKESWNECTRYNRADNAVVIPAADFGRILECLRIYEGDRIHPKVNEALSLASKYGSAE